jgi:hypothetical protein
VLSAKGQLMTRGFGLLRGVGGAIMMLGTGLAREELGFAGTSSGRCGLQLAQLQAAWAEKTTGQQLAA